jgi:hypothetical protein
MMSESLTELEQQARALPPHDRARFGFSAQELDGNTSDSPRHHQELPIFHRLSARGGWRQRRRMASRQAIASFKCPTGAEAGFTLISMS